MGDRTGKKTGIERLREFAAACAKRGRCDYLEDFYSGDLMECVKRDCSTCLSGLVQSIADQIEREQQEPVRDFEDVSGRDSDVLAWVEANGGLEQVRARCYLADETAKTVTGRRVGMSTPDSILGELRCRLMPEGMEWPSYKVDGGPVRIGDETDRLRVDEVRFGIPRGGCTLYQVGSDGLNERSLAIKPGERVKRADFQKSTKNNAALDSYSDESTSPKVLDADGVEIRVGDTVYGFAGQQYEVTGLCEYEPSIVHAKTVDDGVAADELLAMSGQLNSAQLEASKLTHRAPVLASDGKPLREGEHVWHVETGREYVVMEPSYGKTVVVRSAKYDDAEGEQYAPDQLTHERPDSWERLEEDAGKSPCEYFGFDEDETCGKCPASTKNCEQTMARDIVRRSKALAGVE